MNIRKMTATFGCLDGAQLELHEGINVQILPNEGGKSTWTEFLTAMFYGLDPRRSAKGRLSHKERYTPWNGKTMEGTLELSVEGRTIILQRTTTGTKPFGTFRAYDKQTGLEITSLSAETCGQTLLGVEREVFRRSALLSGSDLAVTPEHDLSRRLESLAAAGRQTDSFLRADKMLHTWHNRLRYSRTGEIPVLEEKKRQLEQAMYSPAPDTQHLPTEEELLSLLAGLQVTEQTAVCPPALMGLDQEEILPKVQHDLLVHKLLTAAAVAAFAVSGVLAAVLSPYLWIGALAALGWGLWHCFGGRLPRRYGVKKPEQILSAAIGWRDREMRRMEQEALVENVRGFAPEVQTAQQAQQQVRLALEQYRLAAQIEAGRPDPRQIEELDRTLEELYRREQAILLARQALAQANTKLQQTYVPQLTKLAGAYLQELTMGRYDALVMNEQMELSLRGTDGILRPLAALSTGTQDQTWLALRLDRKSVV